MQHETQRDIRNHAMTGEVYINYPRSGKLRAGWLRRFTHWCSQQHAKHIERLVALRVYDDHWYDYRIK